MPVERCPRRINWRNFDNAVGFPDGSVACGMHDSKSNLWFSSLGSGISRYDGTKAQVFTEKDGLLDNMVNAIAQDNSGNIYVTTEGGICRFDGQIWRTIVFAY